ncbi:MAG TPA: DegV family protein [Thermoflexia bacterium]|nr:DegV family protein [Thermoflexia bacterium]
MKRIAIVTDSAADLPPELVEQFDISVIPLHIHWGDETFFDGVTLKAANFYHQLAERAEFPKTSQPSVGEFCEFFQATADRLKTATILGIFLSSPLSGTLASAIQAQAMLPHLQIELVDSRFISMGVGFQVLTAARAQQQNIPLAAITTQMATVRSQMRLFIVLDTLEYLHRGGRIGGAAHLFGSLLNLRPLLGIENGKIVALGKVRGRRKSLQHLVELLEKELAGRQPAELAIMHAEIPADAAFLAAQIQERVNPRQLYTGILTPALGCHGGPGAIGIAFYPESE